MAVLIPAINLSAQTFRDSVDLEPVVVTASLSSKALKDAPVVTRLITLHDIKITDATNIQDLLTQEIPGLEFGFAMAQETSLNMSGPPPPRPERKRPPVDRHDLSMFMIIILMLGANLGLKYYFQNEEEKKRLAKLKEQSLKQELDYLRYQINPHFIMNTLNNIHALVDIDPEQAKDSIVDMSRLMRYLLYECDKNCVSVNKALVFLKKYLNLMKLRYTDQVTVNLDVPDSCPEDISLVPLVFIPFVENAFKHGVSYDKPSTIDIDIRHCDGRLLFHCRNTKSGVKHEYGGVGLNNVTKRLELIYGADYSLDIKDEETTYDVLLDLPARCADYFNGNMPVENEKECKV